MTISDSEWIAFLQWCLPRLSLRWRGFRKVRRQVIRRLKARFKTLGLESLEAYRLRLEQRPEEWDILASYCWITISRFYRDRDVFDQIRDLCFPSMVEQALQGGQEPSLRIWSAGCASGEEPYTLKIIWEQLYQAKCPQLSLQILAVDANPKMLERAKEGCYQASSVKELPQEWRASAFQDCGEELRIADTFREGIDFQLALLQDVKPSEDFHMILCRNLAFMYFSQERQKEILSYFMQKLRFGGFLVIGKHESLPVELPELHTIGTHLCIFQKRTL